MSLMNTELYNALRAAQVPDDLAEAAAQSVVSPKGLASKEDVAELRTELRTETAAVRVEIAAVRTDMAAMKAELIKWMVGLHAATLLALIGALIAILVRLP
jgi:hypothetical protein